LQPCFAYYVQYLLAGLAGVMPTRLADLGREDHWTWFLIRLSKATFCSVCSRNRIE